MEQRGAREHMGLIVGPLLAATMLVAGSPGELEPAAWVVAALTLWMAVWWVSEAVPVAVTALLPLVFLPLLGVADIEAVAAPYAHPLVLLFLGGFLIALAIRRCDLHRRMALLIVAAVGYRPDRLVAGFMLATAFLSMWISNTATAAMMLPIGLSVIALLEEDGARPRQRFAVALLLGIAWGANIGGMGTLIGTPPNALLAAYMNERHDLAIGYVQWMMVGVPVAVVLLGLAWWLLVRVVFPLREDSTPEVAALFARERQAMGPLSTPEIRVLAVFLLVVMGWMTRPLLQTWLPAITDTSIALAGAVALFLIPERGWKASPLLVWRATQALPWGVLILVGGGLSLGAAIDESGLAMALAGGLQVLAGLPVWLGVLCVALLAMALSHVTSNTATAAMLIPLAAGLAPLLDLPPLLLALPVVLAASCAFMLPVATPPNAIVFGSERLTIPDMVRGGSVVSLAALAVIVPAVFLLGPLLLGMVS